jgi:hypothetical protein
VYAESIDENRPRTLIVADGDVDQTASHVAASVAGDDVWIVAPAGPVAGERWIVDVQAREANARRRLDAWMSVLSPRAWRVGGEIGDANVRLAVGDARAVFDADDVIHVRRVAEPARPARRAGRALRWPVAAYAGAR